MSIVLPLVLNLTEQKAETYVQDCDLRSTCMHAVDISKMYCCYLGTQFEDDNKVLLAYNSLSMMKVF